MAPQPAFNPTPHRFATTLFGAYPTRIMLALATSIGLVALCFHLPLDVPLNAIGWQFAQDAQQPLLDVSEIKLAKDEQPSNALITLIEQPGETTAASAKDQQPFEAENLPAPAPPPLEKLKVLQVLDFAEKAPSIVGGLGAYYIHIQYPEEAIAQNIQGRLILDFVVEPDGKPSHIRILQSLHPLCDSSAVAALQKTLFIPGRENGEAARVRMRLPVRFKLLGNIQPVKPTESDSTAAKS